MKQMLAIIADDFTGALDTGVEFVHAGLDTMLTLLPDVQQRQSVQLLTTNSRDGDAYQAQQRTQQAVRQLQGRRLFKKIDSTMRGHVGLEIETILHASQLSKAVVCPAVIEAGRTIQQGQLCIHAVPLHHTDFANDPRWPARSSAMAALIGRPTSHIELEIVRTDTPTLALAISGATTAIVTLDACSNADLLNISRAISADMLPCGALGLARPWAAQFRPDPGRDTASAMPSLTQPLLIVAGSRHPTTSAQLSRLQAKHEILAIELAVHSSAQQRHVWLEHMLSSLSSRRSILLRVPSHTLSQPEQESLLELLGDLTMQACQKVRLGGLMITGGETASVICRYLGSQAVHIRGSLEVGVPWGYLLGGIGAGLPLITKAGGFGQADTLLNIARHAQAQASAQGKQAEASHAHI